jgi:hypothetical protein
MYFGLSFGLGAAVQHGIIRLLFARYDIAPIRYVRWLDHAVSLRLLYRGPGGGFIFMHRLLQEYLADVAESRSG